MIEGHGDDAYRYAGSIEHNFSSNVFYKGCPAELLARIAKHVETIQNYPSPSAQELNSLASVRHGVPANQFLFTNGATEAFYLIAQAFADKQAAIVAPTFSEYEDACNIYGLRYRLVHKNDLTPSEHGLVFLCNPNNPDGSVLPTGDLMALIENHPSTIFVIDEAYIEFTNKVTSIAPEVMRLPNLVVVRSLTKTFAIPGIRLGYVMASDGIIQKLLAKKMPWSVNALAIYAGLQIFEHYDQWQFDIHQLLEETRDFMHMLSAIDWMEVMPSETSYFLVKLKKGTAAELKHYLAAQHKILVRDATNFKQLEGQYIRLATQSPTANRELLKALKTWN